MVSDNIDRTAVVKLAVLGVPPKEGESSYDIQLQNQLHDFSYSVISDNSGDSYVFKIELINFDETIHKTLVNAFAASLNRDRKSNNLVIEQDILNGFPKLLIQWGYPGSLSKVHVAQLSDLKYKFTQAKEKVLIIEAVNAGDWAETFFMNTTYSSKQVAMDTKSLFPSFLQDLSISKLIFELLLGSLNNVRGIDVTAELQQSDYDALDKEIESIIQAFSENIQEDSSDVIKRGVAMSRDFSAQKKSQYKYQALMRFFQLIGFQFSTVRDLDSFKDEEGIYPIYSKPFTKAESGTHGEIISYASQNQLNKPGRIDYLSTETNANRTSVNTIFDINSGNSQIIDDITDRVNKYNNERGPGEALVSIENVQLVAPMDSNDLRKIEAGSNVRVTVINATGHDNDGNFVSLGKSSSWPTITPSTYLWGGDSLSIQNFAKELTFEAQKEAQEGHPEVAKDIVPDTVSDRVGDTAAVRKGTRKTFSELKPLERQELLYSNIKIGLHSREGTSTLTTVKSAISNFNKLMSTADNHIFINETDIAYGEQSFEEILSILNTLSDDSKYKASTRFRFSRGKILTGKAKSRLKDIISFPKINRVDMQSGNSIAEMSYGKSDSIVKYFDFTGDIRYLTNMQASVATLESLESVYDYLSQDSQIKILPVVDFLLNSQDFKNALADKYKTDNEFIKNLEQLAADLKIRQHSGGLFPVRDIEGLDYKFLMQSEFITAYLKNNREDNPGELENALPTQGLGESEDLLTTAEVFFATISTSLGIGALFTPIENPTEEPKVDILERALAVEEDREPIIPAKSVTYKLSLNNPFDVYKVHKDTTTLTKASQVALETLYQNLTTPWDLKIKTLGIPELDTLDELIAPRYFNFEVHDLSKEMQVGGYHHWLTGLYRPMAINHKINNSVGYISEFTLLKEMGSI